LPEHEAASGSTAHETPPAAMQAGGAVEARGVITRAAAARRPAHWPDVRVNRRVDDVLSFSRLLRPSKRPDSRAPTPIAIIHP
jgi:hypothetical protein